MKMIALLTTLVIPFIAQASFREDAPKLAEILKTSLVKELQSSIVKNGVEKSVSYCHENVKTISQKAAVDYLGKYQFGRTSHKIRNPNNQPEKWMEGYLKKFQNLKQSDAQAKAFFHEFADGKSVYLEPLWVGPLCLNCHGNNVAETVSKKVTELYPHDKATGFRLGEFRGFLWVKEK